MAATALAPAQEGGPTVADQPQVDEGGNVLVWREPGAKGYEQEEWYRKWLQWQGTPALRYAPSLQVPQGLLVKFLTGGFGFDDTSVAAAVEQGNELFARRELPRAIDVYGAAYEIGRLHFDYRPLMHDLVLRRVLCYSMLGDLKQALQECDLALRIIPNAATAFLIQGILHSKLGSTDEANQAFQQAVAHCRELRDVTDCIVGLFMLGQGHCDRVIQICSRVLERTPQHPFALLVRGDAYKFHASGYFAQKAAGDYTALLEQDLSLQSLIGQRFNLERHASADELLLRFHPRLHNEGPRAYASYPMYRKRHPFFVTCWVVFALAKLRTSVQSTKLVVNVLQQNQEMLRQRAAAERRMLRIFEVQKNMAAMQSHAEVWGPADPDHARVRKYRRYWMERPLGFPRRDQDDSEVPLSRSASPPTTSRSKSPNQQKGAAARAASLSAAPPSRYVEEWGSDKEWASAASGSDAPPPPSWRRPGEVGRRIAEEAPPPLPLATLPPSAGAPPQAAGGADHGQVPVLVLARRLAALQPSGPEEAHGAAAGHGGELGPAPLAPFGLESKAPLSWLMVAEQQGTAPGPDQLAADTPAAEVAAQLSRNPAPYPEIPPLPKLGHDWDAKQWLAKALELADTFSASADGDLESPPRLKPAQGLVRPAPRDTLPCCSAVLWMPAAGGGRRGCSVAGQASTGETPSCASGAEDGPETAEGLAPGCPAGEGLEVNLVEAIERFGLDVIPDWYTPVDRIYEVTEMKGFSANPEPLVAAPGLAGAPGYSYVVPRSPSRRERELVSMCGGSAHPQPKGSAVKDPGKRYQHRLLAASPAPMPGAGRVAVAAS